LPFLPIHESSRGCSKSTRHAKRYREAAAMLTRFGSGRCLVCGDVLASDGPGRRYCAAHQSQASIRERADREAILTLLNSAADALRID
jgi:hypothetical protein